MTQTTRIVAIALALLALIAASRPIQAAPAKPDVAVGVLKTLDAKKATVQVSSLNGSNLPSAKTMSFIISASTKQVPGFKVGDIVEVTYSTRGAAGTPQAFYASQIRYTKP